MTLDPTSVPCILIERPDQLEWLHPVLDVATHIAIDTEVPIEGPAAGQMRVMSLAARGDDGTESAFVIDVRHLDPTLLQPYLSGVEAAAWNANFDARVVDRAVWESSETTSELTWWDAQLADALLHQGRSGFNWYHGLAWAAEHYLGVHAHGKGSIQLSFTATEDLTPQQVAYAAADAVETLWVSDAIRSEIAKADLQQICELEMKARPFLDQMERSGLPFDGQAWQQELAKIEVKKGDVLARLAAATGGGQANLFDDRVLPGWNPGSDKQVRQALNQWAPEQVQEWTSTRFGTPRLLVDTDSVTATVLREVGGELADLLLQFRTHSKTLSTYGESILEHLDRDGRIRPQYLQVVGTNTGRLASRNPNAQNFTPSMKPYFRPAQVNRVFVHADLSQAELRYLAHVADDETLRRAFEQGVDVHATTASLMFRFDPTELKVADPAQFKRFRQIAKALNFGIAYGAGARALARTLSGEGTPTTQAEAEQLLARYRLTYPGTTRWAERRVAEIADLKDQTRVIDWSMSMDLARSFGPVAATRRDFRAQHRRWPTAAEIAEIHPERHQVTESQLTEKVAWVLQYPAPVALDRSGQPFIFSSRTLAGRRQQFDLHLDRLFLQAAIDAITSDSPGLKQVTKRFERDHHIRFQTRTKAGLGRPSEAEIKAQFESRPLRRKYVEAVRVEIGREEAHRLLYRAARQRVSVMVNAWRNAPIQGGVADIMLVAYGDLHHRLASFAGAKPVQTVHDSIVIECDEGDAEAVAEQLRASLEVASRRLSPSVKPQVDLELRRSLSEEDIIKVIPDPTLTGNQQAPALIV